MPDATPRNDPPDTGGVVLERGARVEVRNTFDGSWSRGFEVVGRDEGGYRIERRSDRAELPERFAPADVRRERKRSTWWV
ncbi:MAG: hypothetical protein JST73_11500 [Actinobacteria bacterium]|nr:hypothetical protein [Actinomycetota bacterium]